MNWRQDAVALHEQGYSWREIARRINVPKSTVSDFLRKYVDEKAEAEKDRPKVLFLDVEVSPSVVVAFSRFKAFSTPDHVLKEPYMLTYALSWAHETGVQGMAITDTMDEYDGDIDDDHGLISSLWEYLDRADIVVAHNAKFDRGWFNQRCIVHGLNPPSPYKLVDTLQMLKKNFSLPSNRLDAAASFFGLERKKSHSGISLWIRCMNGDRMAIEEMLEYNMGDIVTLEQLYNKLQPWCHDLPNMALYYSDSKIRCCGCGSSNVRITNKFAYTALSKYEAVVCNECGKWSRIRRNLRSRDQMKNTLANIIK